MTRDETEVVSAVRQGLCERIGQERFALWFGAGVRFEQRGAVLAVLASDQFVQDRLRKQFLADLQWAGSQVFGCPAEVRFEIDPSLLASSVAHSPAGPTTAVKETRPPVGAKANLQRPVTDADTRAANRRLDSFVTGDGNRVAFSAAQSVVQRPGVMSPLFIHGPTGCGKTHLLEGVWAEFRRRSRAGRAVMLSAEQFTVCFLEALHGKGLPSFRRKCREVDLLVIDDLQFFVGKRATLVELLHTMDTLMRQRRQLVLAADRTPAAMNGLGPELLGRLAGGLVCGIESADFATRRTIAEQMAARAGYDVPASVLQLLAAELNGDARQIAGALNRLHATSEALARPITYELASAALEDLFRVTQRVVHLGDIERAVCDVFGLEPKSLREGRKSKSVSHPRMLAMWLARKYTRAAFSEISQFFGRRSHSTVISAEKKVSSWVAKGASLQIGSSACRVEDAIRRVESQLRAG